MLKIGIIGAGFMGITHSEVYENMENIKVVAVADSNVEKAGNIAAKFNAAVYKDGEDLINSPEMDAIDICLPTPFHKKYAIMAALKGIHILCEKPMARNIQDAKEMMDAANETGVILMIGHCLRFSKEYMLLRNCINSKTYGKLISLRLYRDSIVPTWSEGNWLANKTQSGGVALDLHIHDTDMIVYLLGRPEAVMSSGTVNNITTLYIYPDMTVSAEGSWRNQAGFPYTAGYDAMFEKATIVNLNDNVKVYEVDGSIREIDEIQLRVNVNEVDGELLTDNSNLYSKEIGYFIYCIQNKQKPEKLMPESSAESLGIVLAEMTSMEKHQMVKI